MQTEAEVRQLVADLGTSVWAFAALSAGVESGMLGCLGEPLAASEVGERTRLAAPLVERILDVVASLGLVRREGERFIAEPGLQPFLRPPALTFFSGGLRATCLQSQQLIAEAKAHNLTPGWHCADPEMLQSVGLVSATGARMMGERLVPMLAGLQQALQAPSAAALDVGCGVAALSIAWCRAFPQLRVVGLEPLEAALVQARRNVVAAGLGDRFELRQELVEDLTDCEAFDFVWLPQPFLTDTALRQSLPALRRALRPGGWLITFTSSQSGQDVRAAVSRLCDALWGAARSSAELAGLLDEAGFSSVRVLPSPEGGRAVVVGQRMA